MPLVTYNVRDCEQVWAKLTYNTENKEFHLSIPKDIDLIKSPITLSAYAENGIFELDAQQSLKWVRLRIEPPNRMNIGQFLRDCGITEYDEYALLLAHGGKCSQDWLYIEEVL